MRVWAIGTSMTDAGKLVQVTDPASNVQTYTVDGNGFNFGESDWMGHVTAYTRNIQNQITTITGPMGGVNSTAYDENGRPVSSTDPLGAATTYSYDYVVKDALGKSAVMEYDANGNLVKTADTDGFITEYTYSALDLVGNINCNGGKQVDCAYNKTGGLVEMTG